MIYYEECRLHRLFVLILQTTNFSQQLGGLAAVDQLLCGCGSVDSRTLAGHMDRRQAYNAQAHSADLLFPSFDHRCCEILSSVLDSWRSYAAEGI